MDSNNIFFRADASESLGAGHVVRTMVLAHELRNAGNVCIFFTKQNTLKIVPHLQDEFETYCLSHSEKNELMAMKEINSMGCRWLVVDHYQWSFEQEHACRDWAEKILVIDDLANRKHDADILLDQNFNRQKKHYRSLVPEHCTILTGTTYSMLKKQFRTTRNKSLELRKSLNQLKKIVISLGMTDPEHYTENVLKVISKSNFDIEVDVIMGSVSKKRLKDIQKLLDLISVKSNLYHQVSDMAEHLIDAGLVIGASGSSCWERCVLALPAIILIVADNQIYIANQLHDVGAAHALDFRNSFNEKKFLNALANFIDKPKQLYKMSVKAAAICDGQGVSRVVDKMEMVQH